MRWRPGKAAHAVIDSANEIIIVQAMVLRVVYALDGSLGPLFGKQEEKAEKSVGLGHQEQSTHCVFYRFARRKIVRYSHLFRALYFTTK
jgi:hypothetical protein